ncbi:hypothetical protein D3C87_1886430 [compost metagenome]
MQQQGLGIARELARGEQVGFAEITEVRQAWTQGLGQRRWQLAEFFLQVVNGLAGAAQAQGIAAGEVILDIARHLILKLLRQTQVPLH